MSGGRYSADEIAALFAERCDASGTCRLTRKQVDWLYGVWEREARPPTEQRHINGVLTDSSGTVTHFWSVDILRNRAGILRLRINDFEEKDRKRLAEIEAELAHVDEMMGMLGNSVVDATGVLSDMVLREAARLQAEAAQLRANLGVAS